MPGAIIAIDQDQGSLSSGSPGVARNDLWLDRLITLRSTAAGNLSYHWTLIDAPPGSAVALASTTSQNATFTPDLAGSYRLQLVTNGGGPGNVQILIAAVTKDSSGATVGRGWVIPALGETIPENNFGGQARGWDQALRYILADIQAAVLAAVPVVDTFTNRPTAARGQQFFPTDGGFQQVSDGTSWLNVVSGVPLFEPPSTTALATRTNMGASTLVKSHGCLVFSVEANAAEQVRCAGKSIVTLSAAKVVAGANMVAVAGAYNAWGVYMRESATGKVLSWAWWDRGDGVGQCLSLTTWSSPTATSGNTDYLLQRLYTTNGAPVLMRLLVSGSNIFAQVSADGGFNWVTVQSIATTSAFTTAPDEFGVCCSVFTATTPAPIATFFHVAFAGDA